MNPVLAWCIAASVSIVLVSSCEQMPLKPVGGAIDRRSSIKGQLLQPDGVTPAAGAFVTLHRRDAIAAIGGPAKSAADPEKKLVQTTADGIFLIDSCPAGVYTLEGVDAEGNAVRIDSVVVADPMITTDVASWSLNATGAIRGTVSLDNGGDPDNAFILAFGSERFTQASSDGSFLMSDLPYGDYTLKVVCVLEECGKSQTVPVAVLSGDTTDINPIVLSVPEICVPENATLQYDSVKVMVTLQWDPCDPDISSYNIYRYDNGKADQYPAKPSFVTDEHSFIDSTMMVDQSYTYGVAAVSVNGSISRKAGPFSVIAQSTAFDCDSIQYASGNEPVAVCWDGNDGLRVATVTNNHELKIDFYSNTLELDHTVLAADSVSIIVQNVLIRDDYILFKNGLQNDSIQCHSISGEKRYSFLLPGLVEFDERNDTLYVVTITRPDSIQTGGASSAAYDTAGNFLYLIDETGLQRIFAANDGHLYTLTSEVSDYQVTITVRGFIPETNIFTDIFSTRRTLGPDIFKQIETNGGLYVLYSPNELSIYNKDGLRLNRYPHEYYYPASLSVDSGGRIALIDDWNKVIVLKQR